MDFFDLKKNKGAAEKTQRFGSRLLDDYGSFDPTPSHAPDMDSFLNDCMLKRNDDIYLKPFEHYTEQPNIADITGLRVHFQNTFTPPTLPILKDRQEIIDTVKCNMVTIITAPTGSGKSTQVPQYILDDEYHIERRHCKIVVTQPRRIAAISLTNRVLSERNLPPIIGEDDTTQGTLVGYQIGMDRRINEDTRLTYMTTGVLLRKLINEHGLKEFTHIILDEVHERDKDTDFLLLLIKQYLCKYPVNVRIIVMSATVDAGKFAAYFRNAHGPAPIIEVKESMFPVTISYLENIRRSLGISERDGRLSDFQEPTIVDKLYTVARDVIKHFDEVDQADYGEYLEQYGRGSVLVFLPGIFEIETMERALKSDRSSEYYDIYCLHSTIPRQSQMRIFEPPKSGRRKIILSTNIAESSITIPDIKYVVDFCLSKELYADAGSGMSSLKYVWAPKSSLDQRKGRAGRVTKGRCYRLISETFLKDLHDFTTPEMQRCSVEQLILWCKMINIGDPEETLAYALDPPDLNRLREGALLLLEVGALVLPKSNKISSNPLNQNLTFLGNVMGTLPLDVRLSRLIMYGLVFDCLSEAIIMAACLSLPQFMEVPYNNREEKLRSYVSRMKKAMGTFSDPIMMLNVYNNWYNLFSRDGYRPEARQYCADNFVNYNRINEVASLVHDLCGCLGRLNIPDGLSRYREDSYSGKSLDFDKIFIIKLALAAANYPFYFVQEKDHINKEECLKMFGSKSPADTVMYTGLRFEVNSGAELERKYKSDLSRHFKDVFDPVKNLYKQGNRLYVTFDMITESQISKSVYYALKTKQLGFSLKLKWKKDTVIPVAVPKSYALPEKQMIDVFVTYIESPTKFFVQITSLSYDNEDFICFAELHDQIRTVPRDRIPVEFIQENMYGLTFFDNEYDLYRVRVVQRTSNYQIKVYFVDYGNSKWIDCNILFKMPIKLLSCCPFQAVECSIDGICPRLDGSNLTRTQRWDTKLVNEIRPRLENKLFKAKVYFLLENVLHVDLYEGSNSLKRWLKDTRMVDYSADDYRTEYARIMVGPNTVTLFSVDRAPQESEEYESEHRQEVCSLSGPSSPYELAYTGLTDTARSYVTRVDPNSVCSIMLCNNPSNNFTEMLSASSVALTSSGNRIQLRGTTQHIAMPGLPDLLVLLFAPKIQLHTTASGLNYVGCVAGLGVDEKDVPVWQDHDLNVIFDHRIYSADIELINKIRLAASDILKQDDENPTKFKYTENAIIKFQRRIQQDLSQLRESFKNRPRAIDECDRFNLGWGLRYGAENSLDVKQKSYSGEDIDVLRPHSTLYFPYKMKYLQVESDEMRDRVDRLVKENHRLDQLTSATTAPASVCELCGFRSRSPKELRNHLETNSHLLEKKRLDYWPDIYKVLKPKRF